MLRGNAAIYSLLYRFSCSLIYCSDQSCNFQKQKSSSEVDQRKQIALSDSFYGMPHGRSVDNAAAKFGSQFEHFEHRLLL